MLSWAVLLAVVTVQYFIRHAYVQGKLKAYASPKTFGIVGTVRYVFIEAKVNFVIAFVEKSYNFGLQGMHTCVYCACKIIKVMISS